MLKDLNLTSIEDLINKVVPDHVKDANALHIGTDVKSAIPHRALTETEILSHMKSLAE